MARIRTLFVVALSAVTLLVLGLPSAHARVVFDKVFVKPSVAAMYPSGLEWDSANDRIVVADTGRNRILIYSLTGNRQDAFGHHGTGHGEFDTPRDVAVDDQGRIYVADAANDRIQAFSAAGNFRWATQGQPLLNQPIGVTWDSENNVLLVASTGQDRVKAFSAGGSLLWSSPVGLGIGFDAPRDVARDPDGRLWVIDYVGDRVVAYDIGGGNNLWQGVTSPDLVLGPSTGGADNVGEPYNIDFSPNGEFAYVTSTANSRVFVWDLDPSPTFVGAITTKCQEPCANPTSNPNDAIEDLRRVAVTDAGQLITADFWGSGLKVFRRDSDWSVIRDIEGDAARPRGVAEAFGVDVGPNGTVYAVDRLNQHVEWYSRNGAFQGKAGSRGGPADAKGFSWPEAVSAASNGVWTADSRGGKIQLWSPNLNDGAPEMVPLGVSSYIHDLDVAPNDDVFVAVGLPGPERSLYRVDGGTHAFQTFGPSFSDPQGVAVNNKFIFVADAGANEIVKLRRTTGAVISRSSVRLHGAEGVAVAPNGHVWVADTNANTIVHLRANLNLVQRYKPRGNKALDLPHTLAVSPDGDWLFVADTFNNRVLRFEI